MQLGVTVRGDRGCSVPVRRSRALAPPVRRRPSGGAMRRSRADWALFGAVTSRADSARQVANACRRRYIYGGA
eukprot:5559445-Prymnesium_polylepis.1